MCGHCQLPENWLVDKKKMKCNIESKMSLCGDKLSVLRCPVARSRLVTSSSTRVRVCQASSNAGWTWIARLAVPLHYQTANNPTGLSIHLFAANEQSRNASAAHKAMYDKEVTRKPRSRNSLIRETLLRRRKLAKFVANHILRYVHRNILLPIMYHEPNSIIKVSQNQLV